MADLAKILLEINHFIFDNDLKVEITDSAVHRTIVFAAIAKTGHPIVHKYWKIPILSVNLKDALWRGLLCLIEQRDFLQNKLNEKKYTLFEINEICKFDLDYSPLYRQAVLQSIDTAWDKIYSNYVAKNLLERFLSAQQQKELSETNSFIVKGRFWNYRLGSNNFRVLNSNMDEQLSFCIHFENEIPIYDLMLAVKLLIETEEVRFLNIAHFTDLATKRPVRPLFPNAINHVTLDQVFRTYPTNCQ